MIRNFDKTLTRENDVIILYTANLVLYCMVYYIVLYNYIVLYCIVL